MDRKRNYLLNDGHIVFNPMDMFGFHGIYPKTMQHSFVDLRVNTHSVESDFSLFNYKDQNTDANFKNNFLKHGGVELPLGNSISKLIGGFIGSKCLVGANRSIPFLGKVLQQYNIFTGNGEHLGTPTMKVKESAADYIKTSVMDAAVLISHSFEMICGEEKPHKKEDTISENLSSLYMHLNTCSEIQEHETPNATPKQSYADVAKSLAVSKPSNSPPEKVRMDRRRIRSAYRTSSNMSQKKYNSDHMPQAIQLSHNSWRNRGEYNTQNKHCTRYMDTHKGSRKKEVSSCSDIKQRCLSTTNSTKVTKGVLQNHKSNPIKSKQMHLQGNGKKPPLKRRANANFLNDIKEDCENMIFESESCQKKELNNLEYNGSSSNLLNSYDSISVANRCMNWRCRPNRSLCDKCKMNSNCVSIPDHPQSHSQETTVTCDTDGYEIENEVCVVTTGEKNADFSTGLDSSMRGGSVAVAESSTFARTRLSSECSVESEDSFIILFDSSVNCSDDEVSETASNYSDTETDTDTGNDDSETINSDDDSDEGDVVSMSSQCSNLTHEDSCGNDECDLVQACSETEMDIFDSICLTDEKLREANALWESAYEDISAEEKQSEKVQFADSQNLATVHPILAWDFAYRAARCGPWEQLARDRVRFQSRIKQMDRVLGPVLTEEHRRHMWQKLYSQMQEIT